MTIEEFVGLDAKQVRVDKGLMQLYVKFYEAAFSFTPNCVGCSFKAGFKKLAEHVRTGKKNTNFGTIENTLNMEKTFVLKNQYRLKILTYKKDGRIYRKYGYALDEQFARELVRDGQTDLFSKLPDIKAFEQIKASPDVAIADVKSTDVDYYGSMDYRDELIPVYNVVKERTGKKAKSFKKTDIIAFLKANEG